MSISTIIQGIQGLREWYGNLNSATLTGAIDVIVVEQEDGTYLSSPFHVRFGKLGVLKAKEKIVDIEINDEPVNIHMKLDDAGAAFFVEGIPDEEENIGIPPELATSPLPNTYFPPHWDSKGKDGISSSANRSLLEAFNEQNENDSSTSECDPATKSFKRVPGDTVSLEIGQEATEEKPSGQGSSSLIIKEDELSSMAQADISNIGKKKLNHKKRKRRSMNKKHTRSNSRSSVKDVALEPELDGICEKNKNEAQGSDDIFDMDDVNIENDRIVQTTHSELLENRLTSTDASDGIICSSNSFPNTPIATNAFTIVKESVNNSNLPSHSSLPKFPQTTINVEGNLANPTIHSFVSKLHTSPLNCTNENSFLTSRLPDAEQLDSMFSKSDIDPSDDSDEGKKNMHPNRNVNVQYFSDPENYSPINSPIGSRPGTPIMSDSEIMSSESSVLKKARENEGKERGEQSWEWGQLPSTTTTPSQDNASKTPFQQKDTTVENDKTEATQEDSGWKFLWFRSRSESSNKRNKDDEKTSKKDVKDDKTQAGVTLESLKTDEDIRKYIGTHFHSSNKSTPLPAARANSYNQIDSDAESGNGPSLPMSPHSVEGINENENQFYPSHARDSSYKLFKDIEISLCGPPKKDEEFSPTLFDLHKVPFDEFVMLFQMSKNPFDDPNLVVRIQDQYYNWKAAFPIIMSMALYQRSFPTDITNEMGGSMWSSQKQEKLSHPVESAENEQGKQSSWWPFSSKGNTSEPELPKTDLSTGADQDIATAVATAFGATETVDQPTPESSSTSDNKTNSSERAIENTPTNNSSDQVDNISLQILQDKEIISSNITKELISDSIMKVQENEDSFSIEKDISGNDSVSIDIENHTPGAQMNDDSPKTPPKTPKLDVTVSSSSEASHMDDILRKENIAGKFRKTLRLSSDLIKALNLRPGSNEIQFSVTTAYQGTTKCRCHLYLWKWTDKIVISDIDGTITKSDVLGHILPIIGKDWAQSGVASLFSKIVSNGYHIAYLSARSIGHAAVTKDYLKSVTQADMNLPDGPLLLNPTSLVSALHREVIIKKPEEFKIACLRDIQKLFPENPFYCGYGNRTNDVFAYRAVGIPISRIFTINSKGELRHELTQTFQTSYDYQSEMVDHIFPPVSGADGHDCCSHVMNFSSFTYWREPVVDITLQFENETKKSDPSSQKSSQNTKPESNASDETKNS